MEDINIVIVNWQNFSDTRECIKGLIKHTSCALENIIVVDNGSTNNSIREIRSQYPQIHILSSPVNKGFSAGNNSGIRYALKRRVEYILLLNSDTVVKDDFLTPLHSFLRQHKDVGSVQSLLLRQDDKNIIDSLGHKINHDIAIDEGFGKTQDQYGKKITTREIFGPCAAAMLVKRDVFNTIGLLDERFFMIFEDVDFSWRMREAGFRTYLISDSVVLHKRGVSRKTLSKKLSFHISKNRSFLRMRYYPLGLKDILLLVIRFPYQTMRALYFNAFVEWVTFVKDAAVGRIFHRAVDAKIYSVWGSDGLSVR